MKHQILTLLFLLISLPLLADTSKCPLPPQNVKAVLSDDGNKITVTTPSGDQTVEGTKVAAIDNSENEKLCRTWIIEDRFKVDGLATKLSDRKEFDKTGRPTEFTLTKSGTFYVKFAGGSSEAGDWNWKVTGTSFNIADIVSYAFSNFAIEYGKLVTIRFSIDGSNYEGYLTEKI